ncbi:MAG: molybdopterin binding aldehyde oxidase and xanthine dehydrogenase [Hyphomicrobiales bacterium]|nr:molybdopterin binding aldehyde oxidase and xanthine dehydrogenase [Hyphomicrobiales bacterium]
MNTHPNRRHFLGGAGALTVSVLMPGHVAQAATNGLEKRPPLDPRKLASYVSIQADGSAVAYFGKMDMGQGTDVGVAQMVAEELDLPAERVLVLAGDSGTSLNQGGASGSTGVSHGGATLRNAAAEARFVMLEMASKQLGVPVEDLTTANGVISSKSTPAKKVSYGELIGGRWFDTEVEWNGQIGNNLSMKTRAKLKDPKDYKVYGTSAPRRDVAYKLMGTGDFVTDIKVPGMLHARMIMPPVAGSVPTAVDEASIKDIPGAKVVWEKAFLGVVAPKEWDAIKAMRQLQVTWSEVKPPFPEQKDIYDHIRNAKVVKSGGEGKMLKEPEKVEEAFKQAARIIEATYEWPFQTHASMGPACAVVDYQPNGTTTLWTGSQKPHFAGDGVATILGIKPESVHAIWVAGPGSYGRNDAGDAAAYAAIFSKATGKPVRYQGMRNEGTGWGPKAPASVHKVRAGLDKDNNIIAWHFHSKSFDRLNVSSNESKPEDLLGGQMLGATPKPGNVYGTPAESYVFPVKQQTWETIAPLLDAVSPLRSSHLRDPLGPEIHFANESFIDEVAFATGKDPVEMRLALVGDPRDRDLIKAAADKAGWQRRTEARKQRNGDLAIGQGIAYSQRNGTRVAVIAEVEVDMKTGKVRGKKFTVSHDCGVVINPRLLTQGIEGNVCQALSRATHEEVKFSKENVTSVDWETYPILDFTERPVEVDVVLINRQNLPPTGAGEGSMRPVAAAIANAIYDATGVRMRQAPFTPDRLKAGMA